MNMNNESVGKEELNNLLNEVEDELLYHMSIIEKAIKTSLVLKDDTEVSIIDSTSDYDIAKSFVGDCTLSQLECNSYDIFDAVDRFLSAAEKCVKKTFDMNDEDDADQENK